jgi:hypothetical protein
MGQAGTRRDIGMVKQRRDIKFQKQGKSNAVRELQGFCRLREEEPGQEISRRLLRGN